MRSKSSLSKKIVAVAAADPKKPSCMKTRSMEKATPAIATSVRKRWCRRVRRVRGVLMASWGFLGIDFHSHLVIDQLGGGGAVRQPDAHLHSPAVHFGPGIDVVHLVLTYHGSDEDHLPLQLFVLALRVLG